MVLSKDLGSGIAPESTEHPKDDRSMQPRRQAHRASLLRANGEGAGSCSERCVGTAKPLVKGADFEGVKAPGGYRGGAEFAMNRGGGGGL